MSLSTRWNRGFNTPESPSHRNSRTPRPSQELPPRSETTAAPPVTGHYIMDQPWKVPVATETQASSPSPSSGVPRGPPLRPIAGDASGIIAYFRLVYIGAVWGALPCVLVMASLPYLTIELAKYTHTIFNFHYNMFRSTTASVHNKHCRSTHVIMRSRRVVPEYHSPCCSAEMYGEALMDQEEGSEESNGEGAQYGDFSVLNHTNHPGAVYYFVEIPQRHSNPAGQRNVPEHPINIDLRNQH